MKTPTNSSSQAGKMGITMDKHDIDRSHRIRPKPLIVKFARYNARRWMYGAKAYNLFLYEFQFYCDKHMPLKERSLINKNIKKPWINRAL